MITKTLELSPPPILTPQYFKQFPAPPANCVLYLPGYPPMGTTITDHSGQATPNNGTITGATWTRLPNGLWYPSFDGDDKINVSHATSIDIDTEDFSVGAWANLTTNVTNYRTILWKAESAANYAGYYMFFSITTGYFNGGIDGVAQASVDINDTTNHLNTGWHLYFMTVDRDSATGLKIWVDGVNVATGNPTTITSLTNTNPLYIG